MASIGLFCTSENRFMKFSTIKVIIYNKILRPLIKTPPNRQVKIDQNLIQLSKLIKKKYFAVLTQHKLKINSFLISTFIPFQNCHN